MLDVVRVQRLHHDQARAFLLATRTAAYHDNTSLTNSGDPDIPCFLLLDDPATSYFYPLDWAPIAVTSSEQLHKEPFARLPTALRPHRPVQNWFFVRQKSD
jgi:hypothetical protein